MKNGIYPIVEREKNGWYRNHGKGLALFDIGDRFNPMTAVVRTLAINKLEEGYRNLRESCVRLEGSKNRPDILYVNKELYNCKKAREKFYIDSFLDEGQELRYQPFVFDSRKNHEQIIETVPLEYIEQYDPKKQFRNWELKLRQSEWHPNGQTVYLDLKNFTELARKFLDLNEFQEER